MIDYVIDPNNLNKFGFGQIFPDFFSFKLFTLFDEGAAKTAQPILTRNISLDAVLWESDTF